MTASRLSFGYPQESYITYMNRALGKGGLMYLRKVSTHGTAKSFGPCQPARLAQADRDRNYSLCQRWPFRSSDDNFTKVLKNHPYTSKAF